LVPITDTLPTSSTTLTCLNPAGSYPNNHWYEGATPGSGTAISYTLPATSLCADNETISIDAVQGGSGASADSISFVTTNIEGSTCPPLGKTAGNKSTWQFKANSTRTKWTEYCGGPVPASYVTTLTESSNAATMVAVTAPVSVNYIALTGNITITTPAATAMADGQVIYVDAVTSGTSYTIAFAAGTGVNFGSKVPGDSDTAPGFATACGFVPATGSAWFRWIWSATAQKLVLDNCGVQPPLTAVNIATGGTGANNLSPGIVRSDGTTATGAELSGDVTTSGSNAATVASVGGATAANVNYAAEAHQYISYAEYNAGQHTITIPTGMSYCELQFAAAGSGGSGVVTNNSTQCSGSTGVSGGLAKLGLQLALLTYSSPLSITIGAGGLAGTNDNTTPTLGQVGGNTTVTINGQTFTESGGTVPSVIENTACNASTGTGSGGGGVGNTTHVQPGLNVLSGASGAAAVAGTSSTGTPQYGPAGAGGNGGNSGSNTSGNVAVAPTAGEPGWVKLDCIGPQLY
jgi:hypothetical protein